ncbi:DUF1428 domain-containing protein [Chelativorans sp. YIM 93263]|uniref:DUF1428 domain-containing protein n=1 Tax=Chelativorans sp. YIM 93263 TaxID=2906648 RepID=UPI002378ADFB|nr:DUF1428 domain-containing protein [Chelativorans sp. YIM 93263]
MSYINGMVAAVPSENKDAYLAHVRSAGAIFKEYGATQCVDAWGDDVPHGKVTDFHRAVQATADETVVFSWITWPDKATHDAAWEKIMQDPRMTDMKMPFDGQRMVYGGFETLLES